MNKFKRLILLGGTLTLLTACAEEPAEQSEVPTEEETEVVEEVEAEKVEVEETPVEESDVGKRSNPVPVGEWIAIEETYYSEDDEQLDALLNVRITDVIRGEEALNVLMEENQFNEPAPEGHEWVIINIEAELLEGSEDDPYTIVPWFSVMDSTGSQVSQDDYGTLDGDEYGHVDLFPGGTTSGRYAFYTVEGDETLLTYEKFLDGSIYFNINN